MMFKEIIGHERPIQILKTALQRRRLAHAYLFYGEEGIGRHEVAKAFAKAANCLTPLTTHHSPDSCGQCHSCVQIEAETHPDFLLISPEGSMIKIGQVRELQERIYLKPIAGEYRFVIFDRAESINVEAANALLKVLEEPPDRTVLILITTRLHGMLETVVSRCQRIRFSPLTIAQTTQILHKRYPQTPFPFDRLATLAMGKVGEILEMDPEALLAEDQRFKQALSGHSPGSMAGPLDLAQEYARDRESTERALKWIGLWLRDQVLLQIARPKNSHAVDGLSIEKAMALAGLVHWIWKALARNINRQLALEVLFLQIRHAQSRKQG